MRPNQIFINRGNHEDFAMNTSGHFKPNFMSDCRRKYGKYAMAVFRAATCLFASLPLASIIQTQTNRVFVVHGGISDQTDLDYLKSDNLKRRLYERLTVPSSYISGSIEDQDDLI